MGNSAITGVNLGVPGKVLDFTDGDLSSGILTFTHSLGSQHVLVGVYDDNNIEVFPTSITATSTTVSTIDLLAIQTSEGGTIPSTWRAVAVDTGGNFELQPTAVLAASVLTDNTVPRGDGGVRGVQDSTITVTDNGEMNNPSQPAFRVSAAGTQTNIAIGTNVTVLLPNETYDIGLNFASNLFTAPVTGIYQLHGNIRFRNIDSAARYELKIIASSAPGYGMSLDCRQFVADIAGDVTLAGSVNIEMAASDTVLLSAVQNGGSVQTDIDGAEFSGILVA